MDKLSILNKISTVNLCPYCHKPIDKQVHTFWNYNLAKFKTEIEAGKFVQSIFVGKLNCRNCSRLLHLLCIGDCVDGFSSFPFRSYRNIELLLDRINEIKAEMESKGWVNYKGIRLILLRDLEYSERAKFK